MNEYDKLILEHTMLSPDRLASLGRHARVVEPLGGDIAEVGVGAGGSALFLSRFLPPNRSLLVFDTFKGLPTPGPYDTHVAGEFAHSLKDVECFLHGTRGLEIWPGLFPRDTGKALGKHRFGLVHIDCDLYEGVRDCLQIFSRRMLRGGRIVLDDVFCHDCPGALKAAREFCNNTHWKKLDVVETQCMFQF